ncbi:MAG TPA: RidA family protein [Saprospiraceae bacterium]|nr:RidA family protein [Saprospiraceae bacterium]
MNRTSYSSSAPWEDKFGYTRAVRVQNIVEVSGTVASQDGVVQHVGDAYAQTVFIINIIQKAIENLGGNLSNIIRTRIYCTNIGDFEAIGRAHGEFFNKIKPAMAMVEVSKLIHPDMLVEIEATAIIA